MSIWARAAMTCASARVIKPLDSERELIMRQAIFADPQQLHSSNDAIDRYFLSGNSWLNWLRSLIAPRRGD